jgi:chromosome segregation ATPase
VDLQIPNSLILLEDIVKERSDNDLACEILELFGGKEQIEILLKSSKENVEKLERQKASLLKELNDARKKISKLRKTDAEGDKSGDVSDSMSGNSSELKTPKSEDLATIERLKKQKRGLEDKLKETKKRNNDEKHELKEKITDFEHEIQEKNSKLQSLKDSLVDQFKIDISKLQKSFESKEKLLEQRILKDKQSEIEKAIKKIESEYQQKISSLSAALSESNQKLSSLTANSQISQNQVQLKIK